jgi:hypothetical protein
VALGGKVVHCFNSAVTVKVIQRWCVDTRALSSGGTLEQVQQKSSACRQKQMCVQCCRWTLSGRRFPNIRMQLFTADNYSFNACLHFMNSLKYSLLRGQITTTYVCGKMRDS